MIENKINEYIKTGIQKEVEIEFEILKNELIEKLNSRKNEICAGILLNVMKTIDIQNLNDRTIFTIKEIK